MNIPSKEFATYFFLLLASMTLSACLGGGSDSGSNTNSSSGGSTLGGGSSGNLAVGGGSTTDSAFGGGSPGVPASGVGAILGGGAPVFNATGTGGGTPSASSGQLYTPVSNGGGSNTYGTSTNAAGTSTGNQNGVTTGSPTCDDNRLKVSWKKPIYSNMDQMTFTPWNCDVVYKDTVNQCEIKYTHAIKHYPSSADTILLTCVGTVANPNGFAYCDCPPGTTEYSYSITGYGYGAGTLTIGGVFSYKQQ